MRRGPVILAHPSEWGREIWAGRTPSKAKNLHPKQVFSPLAGGTPSKSNKFWVAFDKREGVVKRHFSSALR
jgi:hypothetical protein